MVAWHRKFLASHQNLPLFGLFRPRNSRKPEDFGAVLLWGAENWIVALKFLAPHQNLPLFGLSRKRKIQNRKIWCAALVDGPRTGWGLEISSATPKSSAARAFQAKNRKILVRCPCSWAENWMGPGNF